MARVRQPSIPPRNSGHVIRRLGDATPEFNGERSNSISRAQFILLHFLVSVPHPPRQPRLFVVGWHFLLPDAIPQFLRPPPPLSPFPTPARTREDKNYADEIYFILDSGQQRRLNRRLRETPTGEETTTTTTTCNPEIIFFQATLLSQREAWIDVYTHLGL